MLSLLIIVFTFIVATMLLIVMPFRLVKQVRQGNQAAMFAGISFLLFFIVFLLTRI